MTSSSRITDGYHWKYDNPILKDYDSHCEPGLVSILFLSCGKHKLSRVCLDTTRAAIKKYLGEVEWIFCENTLLNEKGNPSEDSLKNIEVYRQFKAERKKVLIQDKNYGINLALNDLIQLSRGEFVLIHEGDWFCQKVHEDFLGLAMEIFRDQPNLDILHLRDRDDRCENWGAGDPRYNPWNSTAPILNDLEISLCVCKTDGGHTYFLSRFPCAYTNNPILIRKRLLRKVGLMDEVPIGGDPRHGETQYSHRVEKINPLAGYINLPLYVHAGGSRRFNVESLYDQVFGEQ